MKIRIKANNGHWRTRLTEALTEMGYTVRVIKIDRTKPSSIPNICNNNDYYVEIDGPEGDITIPPENAKLVKKEVESNEARR